MPPSYPSLTLRAKNARRTQYVRPKCLKEGAFGEGTRKARDKKAGMIESFLRSNRASGYNHYSKEKGVM
jgi:hypothetical protein